MNANWKILCIGLLILMVILSINSVMNVDRIQELEHRVAELEKKL